ncbi:hypothetical protein [Donghicola mangrovi]|uniref:Type II toxin-antitoxin system PemK/MazF family toxin n=1 Tax=Donghicola mangrovi TaxID=2729614 RepID=A0A850Q9W0_9RHOB|nr:hypothetical protein [Donghicola mangrovi]NVO25723.1 hypothetical protein [Donghicola mangrovi]
MFDQPTPANDNTAPSWEAMLAPGDIVSFRFPMSERKATGERPKARPCLVLEVGQVGQLTLATLAYGTTSNGKANRGRDLVVAVDEEITSAGITGPTRFVGIRRVMVPIGHSAFNLAHRDTPVLGHLSGGAFEAMQNLRARFQAERDMAAEFRDAKRLARHASRTLPDGRRDMLTPDLLMGDC